MASSNETPNFVDLIVFFWRGSFNSLLRYSSSENKAKRGKPFFTFYVWVNEMNSAFGVCDEPTRLMLNRIFIMGIDTSVHKYWCRNTARWPRQISDMRNIVENRTQRSVKCRKYVGRVRWPNTKNSGYNPCRS